MIYELVWKVKLELSDLACPDRITSTWLILAVKYGFLVIFFINVKRRLDYYDGWTKNVLRRQQTSSCMGYIYLYVICANSTHGSWKELIFPFIFVYGHPSYL